MQTSTPPPGGGSDDEDFGQAEYAAAAQQYEAELRGDEDYQRAQSSVVSALAAAEPAEEDITGGMSKKEIRCARLACKPLHIILQLRHAVKHPMEITFSAIFLWPATTLSIPTHADRTGCTSRFEQCAAAA
jgi:hypothetical protein